MKVKFFPYDFCYSGNTVEIFGRTTEGKKIKLIDDSIEPFFWILVENPKKLQEKISKIDLIKKTKIEKKSHLGKDYEAIKVFVENNSDIKKAVDKIKDIKDSGKKREIDIKFTKRYILEKEIIPLECYEAEIEKEKLISIKPVKGEFKPKIVAFDIETYAPDNSYPQETRDPIISLALYGDKIQKVITWKKCKGATVVKSEKELIEKFMELVKEADPDYLTGYFSDGFDFPYLKERAKKHKIKLDLGDGLKFSRGLGNPSARINGMPHLDVFKFINNIMRNSLKTENYDLSSVCKELINEEKIDFDVNKIGLAWEMGKHIDEICEYNLNDAEITYKLCKKILPNINELVKICNHPIHDVCRASFGSLAENYLMKKAYLANEIIPNKPAGEKIKSRMGATYEGSFVFEPKPGLYENLAILDFKGFWPTIIAAYNISPGTLTTKKTNTFKTPKIRNKIYHFSKKKNFIPDAIKEIILTRAKLKKSSNKKDPAIQGRIYALKTVANSAYGMLGFFGARWYSVECAGSITGIGRDLIKDVAKKAEKENFTVIYGDNDSIFLKMNNNKKSDVDSLVNKINSTLPDIMEIELEDYYKRGIFVTKKGDNQGGAKKKYAMINDEGELKIMGFETVRRDWSYLAKEVQEKVLSIILKENKPEKALKYVKEVVDKIKQNKFDMEDMVIRTQLKRPLNSYVSIGPHVEVARRMQKKGMPVGKGSIIQYVVTPGKGLIRSRAKLPQEAREYDPYYYLNNQILPSIQRIFEALGYKKEKLLSEATQKSLGDY